MNKILGCIAMGLMLAGCQPKESSNNQAADVGITAERKEESHKLTAQSLVLLGQKNYQGTLASLDAAIKMDPTNQDPYLVLGQILLKSGEYQRASDFLDNAAKNFPDNGMVFYMLSLANKLNGKKLPAALAARRSFELFKNANDQDNAQKVAALLQEIINAPEAASGKTEKSVAQTATAK